MRSSLSMSVVTSVITPAIKSKSCCFMSLLHYPPLMTAGYRCFRARSRLSCCNSHADDDMSALFQILPCDLRDTLLCDPSQDQLVEVILDLGCLPQAHYIDDSGRRYLRDTEVSMEEIQCVLKEIGQFGGDNRAGIEGTLHRISAIRNRKGEVIGLTCRVGRARGQIDMVRDLLDFGESILFVGRPGVGKTTVVREISRVLSDELHKRVVIVDTSNEIGGDGDIPHPAIGGARRLQVLDPSMQHQVMIEAVENHMPEVIIIDEIGTESEVHACRTIAERGVMLIGTAHGEQLENIIKNPTLSDLILQIGGVVTVTLSDQEARIRNSSKSVLERKAPSPFPFLIEINERDYWIVHRTERSVDALLRGKKPLVEVRRRTPQLQVVIERWRTKA
ncbi:uncharacterized protein ycf45 isoform X1 [Solanum pennellii]|uniref:Uncharacterized protein ycf45 isoform X1 n=1 Tax=Solanum pennellii TaxID=28526 RepID=A0ABM1GNM6_SOLPN|nr:uncharacterized protein ycf45 isoform X1 [Solanum pennellii]XP_015073729.1 uncharacterized protein ycf45 isoform X1 [Solanum pennellii]